MKLLTAWAAKVCAVDVAPQSLSRFSEGTEVGISLPYNLAISACCWMKEGRGARQDAGGPAPCTAVTVSIIA